MRVLRGLIAGACALSGLTVFAIEASAHPVTPADLIPVSPVDTEKPAVAEPLWLPVPRLAPAMRLASVRGLAPPVWLASGLWLVPLAWLASSVRRGPRS